MCSRAKTLSWLPLLICLVSLLPGSAAWASDWCQWRGPNRDGWLAQYRRPAQWPAELKRVWSVVVGEGHSSPLLVEGKLYVFSRLEDLETVQCLDLGTGRVLWRQSYPAPYEVNPAARDHGKGPKSTPILAAGKLITLGISGILSCWDADRGQRLWQRRFDSLYSATAPLYGTATSPIVVGEESIVHVGGHNSGALTAFALDTGRTVWRWAEDGPAYTSPILATLAGKRQLVSQSQEHCLGVDPQRGELFWKFPYTTQYTMNIVTPVRYRDLVIFSGYRRGTTAYKIKHSSAGWSADREWHNPDVSMFMSSPVLVADQLYCFAQERRGQLVCLEAASARIRWHGPARLGENAALVVGDGVLFVLTTGAELIVVRPEANRYTELARYQVADTPTWAHPGRILSCGNCSSHELRLAWGTSYEVA